METPYILLVDDNVVQGATRSAILSRAGFKVIVVQEPEAALALLMEPSNASMVRLVVTDHLMPGMNGPELVGRIRQFLPEVPVVVLSGLPDAEAEYHRWNVTFRAKPFPPEDLIALATRILSQAERRSA